MLTWLRFRSLNFLLVLFLAAAIASSLFNRVNAQSQSAVTLTADAGFGGYAKDGKWIPVHITVENKGADINEASVQVSFNDLNNIASVFSANISLPTNSRKELFIYTYFPQGGASNLIVELVGNKKTITKTSARISNLTAQSLVIGLMANTPSNYNGLSQITPQNGITRLIEIKPSDLPDKAQGWESLDALVVSDVDTGVLTSAQRKALELWIAKGGVLLTIGGPKWQPTIQGLAEVLPIQVSGTTNVNLPPDISGFDSSPNFVGTTSFPEEAETVLATGRPVKGAVILASQGGFPLILEKNLGRGKSIFLAADPGLSPFKSWDGTFVIYDALLNFRHSQAAWVNGKWDVNSTDQAITTIAELAVPSIILICGLMVIYILIIGPLNYFFLRIIKKREWAWVSIPAIVIMVTVVSYVYGYFYRGTTPTLSRLTVIQAWDGISQSEKDSMVGIYSPQRKTYTLDSESDSLLYPVNLEDVNVKGDTVWSSVQSGQKTDVQGIPIEIGGMKVIGATGISAPLNLEHNLTIVFDNGKARVTGTITNRSNVTINDSYLVTPARWKALGDLAPGQSQKIDMPIITTTNSPEFFSDGSAIILQASQAQLQLNEDLRRKEAFLRSVITPETGETNSNWGIYLMGWLEEGGSETTLSGFKTKNTDTTLYIHQIAPAVSALTTETTLTNALFEWQSSVNEASPYYSYSYSTGDFSLRFRPAIPLKFSAVKNLTLNLDSYNTPSTVALSLWNFTLHDWETIDNVTWGAFSVPNPEKYVNSTGEVILRIKDAQNQSYIEMNKSTISMVVAP